MTLGAVALTVAGALLAAGCGDRDAGRAAARCAAPRAVSLCSAATESLVALGLAGQLVGVDQHAASAAPGVPVVATGGALSAERLVAMKPDLAFVWWYQRGAAEQLRRLGIRVVALRAQGVDDAVRLVEQVAEAAGARAEGQRVAGQLRTRLGELDRAPLPPPKRRPLVYIELQCPFRSCGPGSYGHDLVVRAGGRNLGEKADSPYPTLSNEAVLAAQPDAIVLVKAAGTPHEDVAARPGWSALRAVTGRRVHRVCSDLLSPGPRAAEAVATLRRLLHPEKEP